MPLVSSLRAVLFVFAVVASGCGPYCRPACPPLLQTIVLVDSDGAPLTPSEFVDDGATYKCGMSEIVCTENRVEFRWRDAPVRTTRHIRVVATSGDVFEGAVMPQFVARQATEACSCGESFYEDLTVTLQRP